MNTSTRIIGLSGKAGAGKNLAASLLSGMVQPRSNVQFSLAAPLKKHVREAFQLTEEQTDGCKKNEPCDVINVYGAPYTPRELMIKVGQFYRSLVPTFWVDVLIRSIQQRPEVQVAFVTDVRFPNEADAIHAAGGLIIRLQRDRDLLIQGAHEADVSETSLDNYDKFDHVISAEQNTDRARLSEALWEFVEQTLSLHLPQPW